MSRRQAARVVPVTPQLAAAAVNTADLAVRAAAAVLPPDCCMTTTWLHYTNMVFLLEARGMAAV
jgi:hypothetical protein